MPHTGTMYHIGLSGRDAADYAILPGDPARVELIAKSLDNPVFVAHNREYTTWSGELCGKRVLVMSTGMGGPSTAIAVEELYQIGVRSLIRVGTCGGMQMKVRAGDLVIATAAVRMEGTTREYLPPEYPAVADFSLTGSLCEAAKAVGTPWHLGVVHSKDSYYGQHQPERMPVGYELLEKWNAFKRLGCLASEMECAALFGVASVLGMRAGAVLLAVWNQERVDAGEPDDHSFDYTGLIRVAAKAVLIDQNR